MLRSRPVNGVPCKFRTCYDVTFWPVEVAEAEWKTPDRLQPAIKRQRRRGRRARRTALPRRRDLFQAGARSLRFYLSGESNLVHKLYELLCNNCVQIAGARPHARNRASSR